MSRRFMLEREDLVPFWRLTKQGIRWTPRDNNFCKLMKIGLEIRLLQQIFSWFTITMHAIMVHFSRKSTTISLIMTKTSN